MQKIRAVALVIGVAGCWALGCRSDHRPEERPATSLVYSPADQVTSPRHPATAPSSSAPGLRAGVRCRVHLRRDAVGLAGGSPLAIVGASILSERASLTGVIERVDADALLLRVNQSTYWVPRDVILAVEFPDEWRP